VRYIKEDAKNLLMEKFGWQPYQQKHFESRFTRFYESYWLPIRFGYDVRRVQFSSLILTGQMTRNEALDILANPGYDSVNISHEIEYVSNKLGITSSELYGYMEMPIRKYSDYKNQAYLYAYGSRILKSIGLEVGGKR
jgi:hypothetical protein